MSGNGNVRTRLPHLFDDAAPDYDRIVAFMALGSGRWYRRQALARAGLTRGMTLLDVGIGTGLVAREALRLVDRPAAVVGVDVSFGMISRAAARLPIALVLGRGEQLPFQATSFDFLSLGYALRHFQDLTATFAEFFRVLKPGGVVGILEITRPEGPLASRALGFYIGRVMPALARAMGQRAATGELCRY